MFPTRILLAVDGSPGSERAARAAAKLSRATGSQMTVLLVEGRVPLAGAAPGRSDLKIEFESWAWQALRREARQRLGEQVRKIRSWGCEVSGAHVEAGRPDAEIVRVSENLGAGLVVVGSRGFGPLKRALMGSVSLGVVRHAHCSVLVVRGEEDGVLAHPILVGLDGSREAGEAAGAGAEISAATGADLHVVHALDPEVYMPYPGPETWEGWWETLDRSEREAKTWVEGEAGRLRDAGAEKVVAHTVLGDPNREIVRLADEIGAGLVVVGSRGLGGVRRMLLGGVSDPVVRHADRSVMVVRPGEPEGG